MTVAREACRELRTLLLRIRNADRSGDSTGSIEASGSQKGGYPGCLVGSELPAIVHIRNMMLDTAVLT